MSRLCWKRFATYAVLTLVSSAVLVVVLSSRQQDIVVERVEQQLHDSAVLLRDDMTDVFQDGPGAGLQATLKRLGEQTGEAAGGVGKAAESIPLPTIRIRLGGRSHRFSFAV